MGLARAGLGPCLPLLSRPEPPQATAREPDDPLPGAPGGASATEGSQHPTHRRYRQAKATKRGERGGGESESLIVSLKRGEQALLDPV